MPEFTVTLSDVEFRAFQHVAVDPAAWIQNVASERARLAIQEIVDLEINRMMNDPEVSDIPATHDEIVNNANLPTAAERQQALEQSHDEAISD